MRLQDYSKYIFIILLLFFMILSFLVIKTFIVSIVTACVLAYLFYPVYIWLRKKIKSRYISSFLVVVLIALLAALPVAIVINSLLSEARSTVDYLRQEFNSEGRLELSCQDKNNTVCEVVRPMENMPFGMEIKQYILTLLKGMTTKITAFFSGIVDFFIALFIVFFLLLDGPALVKKLESVLPLRKRYEKRIIATFNDTTHAVVFGSIITALLQGSVAAAGYYLIGGIDSALLLGLLTAFFALIPYLGTAVVWLPLSAYIFFVGVSYGLPAQMFRGIGLFLFGSLVVGTIDNFLKPKIIGDRAHINPVIVLLGVLGGLKLMGLIGIIVGPLILAITINLIDIMKIERKNL